MNEFNEHVLLVMRWLQNNDLVSVKELVVSYNIAASIAANKTADITDNDSRVEAYAAVSTADIANAAYYAAVDAAADYAAAMANNAAYYTAVDDDEYWVTETEKSLNEYFEITKKDRTAYEKQASYLNVLGANNE